MNGNCFPFPLRSSRLGFHYYPDTLHYRESDLAQWLPELAALDASWLVLQSPLDRAIPEHFIRGLAQAGIEPLINFDLPLSQPVVMNDLTLLFKAYARWGVHGIVLFERPNAYHAWSKSTWARHDLVERFLDRFLPIAAAAIDEGLVPILPPLEPGGSYWDTSFLRSMLTSLVRRNPTGLIEKLVISAYASNQSHDLNWGVGGTAQWPGARAYCTPPDQQDHIGFRIFDWYREISQSVLGRECPIILFGGGTQADPLLNPKTIYSPDEHRQINLNLVKLLENEATETGNTSTQASQPLPDCVIACNLWLLTADPGSPKIDQAWFSPTVDYLPTIPAIKEWNRQPHPNSIARRTKKSDPNHPIQHYLLLPTFEWGVADWHLEVVRPFIKKHLPTIGFSLTDAAMAQEVTIIG
ncbi:MAG: hypothetical protein Q7U74_12520, partial [Saprospiraceae bacterium]|nr:hypothetical protein [Saprospiraceae bacterium]